MTSSNPSILSSVVVSGVGVLLFEQTEHRKGAHGSHGVQGML